MQKVAPLSALSTISPYPHSWGLIFRTMWKHCEILHCSKFGKVLSQYYSYIFLSTVSVQISLCCFFLRSQSYEHTSMFMWMSYDCLWSDRWSTTKTGLKNIVRLSVMYLIASVLCSVSPRIFSVGERTATNKPIESLQIRLFMFSLSCVTKKLLRAFDIDSYSDVSSPVLRAGLFLFFLILPTLPAFLCFKKHTETLCWADLFTQLS